MNTRMYIKAVSIVSLNDPVWIWEVKPDGLHLRKSCGSIIKKIIKWDDLEQAWGPGTKFTYKWDVLTEEEAFLEMI